MQKNKYILASAIILINNILTHANSDKDLTGLALFCSSIACWKVAQSLQKQNIPNSIDPKITTPIYGDVNFLEHIQNQKKQLKKTPLIQIFEDRLQARFNHQNEKAVKLYLNSRDLHRKQERNQPTSLLKEESEFSPYCSIDTQINDIEENNTSPDNTAPSLFNQSANIVTSLANKYEYAVAPHINRAVKESIATVSNCVDKILYETQQALTFDKLQRLINETQHEIEQELSLVKQIDILAQAQMKAYQLDENDHEINMKTFKSGIKALSDRLEMLQGQERFIIGRQDYNPAWDNESQLVLAKKIYKDLENYNKTNHSISTDWLDLLLKCTQLQPETRDVLQLACEEGIKNITSMNKSSDNKKIENYTKFILAMVKKNS